MRTGIPSFLITLGSFFVLQGANLGVTKLVTGSVSTPNINQMDSYEFLRNVFASDFQVGSVSVPITIVWWLFFVAVSGWVLQRTRTGNWIYAVGGNAASARARGARHLGQDRPVHDRLVPGLVHRDAPALPVQHRPGGNASARSSSTSSRRSWAAAC